jgi:hypothetical protein
MSERSWRHANTKEPLRLLGRSRGATDLMLQVAYEDGRTESLDPEDVEGLDEATGEWRSWVCLIDRLTVSFEGRPEPITLYDREADGPVESLDDLVRIIESKRPPA